MTYAPTDPSTWPLSIATGFIVGVDIGLAQDHSTMVVGGPWSQIGNTIGVICVRQFELGMPHTELADAIAATAHEYRAKLVVDTSNNSAFISLLAPRFGRDAPNRIAPVVITNAHSHAIASSPMPVTVGTLRTALPRWTLSKRELIETTAMELDNQSLRIARVGDWEVLRDELATMEQTVRQSGTVTYSAPEGRHDDLVTALSLCVFGCRGLVAPPRPRKVTGGTRPSWGAWT